MFHARPTINGRLTARVIALVAVPGLALAGCSSSGSGAVFAKADGTASTAVPESSAASSPTVAAPPTATSSPAVSTSSSPSSVSAPNELDAVLLNTGDIGAGYTTVASTPPQPLPCTPSAAPVDDQLPNVEAGRINFQDATASTQISEQIYVYGGQTDAVRHQQLDEAGLHCSHGSVSGTAIDVAGPYDVSTDLRVPQADTAQAWSLSNTKVNAELFLVRINGVVVQFSFVAAAGVTPPVDAKQVIQTALHKILARS